MKESVMDREMIEQKIVASYRIERCTLKDNFAATIDAEQTTYSSTSGTNFQGLGRGGGLCIHLKGHSSNNSNSAIWGGGLYISFQDAPDSNVINIENTTFINNNCTLNGGGGVDVGFIFSDTERPNLNDVSFCKCHFLNNNATYRGGILLYYSTSSDYMNLENNVKFIPVHGMKTRPNLDQQ